MSLLAAKLVPLTCSIQTSNNCTRKPSIKPQLTRTPHGSLHCKHSMFMADSLIRTLSGDNMKAKAAPDTATEKLDDSEAINAMADDPALVNKLDRQNSAGQGELTDGQGKTLGEVLQAAAGEEAIAKVKHTKRTPATAEDPVKVTVPADFSAEEGVELYNGWYLGKNLGAGMQGCVFLLADESGKANGRVYKQVNNRLVAEAAGVMTGLEREWVIGQQLNAALNEEDGFLPGFMQTGTAVVDDENRFVGLVLEQLNGKEVTDRLEDPDFADIDYIIECFNQCLNALDKADTALGFRHRDMRIENIMEHRIEEEGHEVKNPYNDLPPGFGPKVNLDGLHFKIIDYGHAVIRREFATDLEAKARTRGLYRLLPNFPAFAWAEHVYRWIFHDRGDVWRLARSIGQAMEGRTWPSQDRRKVERVIKFVHGVTGRKPKAFFADQLPARDAIPATKTLYERIIGIGGSLFFVRWFRVIAGLLRTRIQAYILPGKPNIRPKEALKLLPIKEV